MSTYSGSLQSDVSSASSEFLFSQGWVIRAGARIIDLIILSAASGAAGLVIGVMLGLTAASSGQSAAELQQKVGQPGPYTYLIGLVASLLYFTICQTFHGSTPGKLILGLVVVDEDGVPAGLGANLKREVLFFVDSLVFGLIAYSVMKNSPRQQRIGDKWGHTLVLKRSQLRPEYRREWGTFVIVTLAALILATALNLAPTVLKLF